jgi:hypothetical protein
MTLASGFAPKNDKDSTIAALIGTLVSAALAIVVLSSALLVGAHPHEQTLSIASTDGP